jgi:hypothetical protein
MQPAVLCIARGTKKHRHTCCLCCLEYNVLAKYPTTQWAHAQMPVFVQWSEATREVREILKPRFKAIRTLQKAISRAPAKISYDWYLMRQNIPCRTQSRPAKGAHFEMARQGDCISGHRELGVRLRANNGNKQQQIRKVKRGTSDIVVARASQRQQRLATQSKRKRHGANLVVRTAPKLLYQSVVMSRTTWPTRRGKVALPDTYSDAVQKDKGRLRARQRGIKRRLDKDNFEGEHERIKSRQWAARAREAARATQEAVVRKHHKIAANTTGAKYEEVHCERVEQRPALPDEILPVPEKNVQTKQSAILKRTKTRKKTKKLSNDESPIGPRIVPGIFTLEDVVVKFAQR